MNQLPTGTPRERQALHALDEWRATHPEHPESAEVAARAEALRERLVRERYERWIRGARDASEHGDWQAAEILAERAERQRPEGSEAVTLRQQAEARLAEREARAQRSLAVRALAPESQTAEQRERFAALARATAIAPYGEVAARAQEYAAAGAPAEQASTLRLLASFEPLARGDQDEFAEALRRVPEPWGSPDTAARQAGAMLADRSANAWDAYQAAQRADRRAVAAWIALGRFANGATERNLPRPLEYLLDVPGFAVAVTTFPLRVIQYPGSRAQFGGAVLVAGERYLARYPDGAHAEEVRAELEHGYALRGQWAAALEHAEKRREPDAADVAEYRAKVAEQLLAAAEKQQRVDLRLAYLATVLREYGDTPSAAAARTKFVAEKAAASPQRIRLTREFLLEHPALWAPGALALKPELLDGKGANGEMAEQGVTLLGRNAIEIALVGRDPVVARVPAADFTRFVAQLEETRYASLATDERERATPDAARDAFFAAVAAGRGRERGAAPRGALRRGVREHAREARLRAHAREHPARRPRPARRPHDARARRVPAHPHARRDARRAALPVGLSTRAPSLGLAVSVAVSASQDLERVQHLDRQPRRAHAGADLHEAAGVAGRERLRRGVAQRLDLAREQARRHLGLGQVVDPRGAAAVAAAGQVEQLELGDRAQQRARRRGDPLRVQQVTRIVVGHAQTQRVRRLAQAGVDQELGGVAHLAAERVADVLHVRRRSRPSSRSPRRARRAGTRGGSARAARRRPRGRPEWRCSAPQHTCSLGISTSKPLRASTATVAAFAGPNTSGMTQPVRKPTRPRRAPCAGTTRGGRWGSGSAGSMRSMRASGGASASSRLARTRALHAAALVGAQRAEQRGQPARAGDHAAQREALEGPAEPAARAAPVDLRAHALDQVAVAHARRTGRLAGAAGEAEAHLADHELVERDLLLRHAAHQVDPSARRAGLAAGLLVRRAVRQAQAAVHTVQCRRVVELARVHAQIPPTKRPGASTRPGSKRAFSARISGSASGGAPKTSSGIGAASGARSAANAAPSAAAAGASAESAPSGTSATQDARERQGDALAALPATSASARASWPRSVGRAPRGGRARARARGGAASERAQRRPALERRGIAGHARGLQRDRGLDAGEVDQQLDAVRARDERGGRGLHRERRAREAGERRPRASRARRRRAARTRAARAGARSRA